MTRTRDSVRLPADTNSPNITAPGTKHYTIIQQTVINLTNEQIIDEEEKVCVNYTVIEMQYTKLMLPYYTNSDWHRGQ